MVFTANEKGLPQAWLKMSSGVLIVLAIVSLLVPELLVVIPDDDDRRRPYRIPVYVTDEDPQVERPSNFTSSTAPKGSSGNLSNLWHSKAQSFNKSSDKNWWLPVTPPWQDEGLYYHPFEDMFYPYNETESGPKSLVVFTAGRSGMQNVNDLITRWGPERFDYTIMHFDESASEWNTFPWYKHTVSVTAQGQAKLWFFKRFFTPENVKGYKYVHFVDSDAGSPVDHPFELQLYEDVLKAHNAMIGQPAVSKVGRSSDHTICREEPGMLLRYVAFVENGPLYSVSQEAYHCYWAMISPRQVSGWGCDVFWCRFLSMACGFPRESCVVVDKHFIDHQDKHTASSSSSRGRSYTDYGREDIKAYKRVIGPLVDSIDWNMSVYRRISLDEA